MSIFSKVKVKKVPRTKFNLSHEKKLSTSMGVITPIGLIPVMPNDSFQWNTDILIKMSPLVVPTMERFEATVHYFFVPNRLVWENWEDFITGGEDGLATPVHPFIKIDSTNYQHPDYGIGGLMDYFGIPPQTSWLAGYEEQINALPVRGYNLIYNEYYRDQNLTEKLPVAVTDGEDVQTLTTLRNRAWNKDYFTSALPWAQRGAEVTLPFSEISYKPTSDWVDQTTNTPNTMFTDAVGNAGIIQSGATTPDGAGRVENIEAVGAPTINELRKAYRLQEWLENNARGGARYVEQILSHFGVRFSDYRAQRPIFLGSGRSDVLVSEILNTTGLAISGNQSDGNVQGGYAGNAMTVGRTNGFKHKFQEHGFIHAYLSVQPKRATYFQGVNRMWSVRDKLDYPFPEFANLGEQEILNKEIYLDTSGTPSENGQTFGYTPRYAEHKHGSVYTGIAGDFRDDLDFWHYARKFGTKPALNTGFVEYNNDKRIFNIIDDSEDTLYVQVVHNVSAIRPLPYFGTPRT